MTQTVAESEALCQSRGGPVTSVTVTGTDDRAAWAEDLLVLLTDGPRLIH